MKRRPVERDQIFSRISLSEYRSIRWWREEVPDFAESAERFSEMRNISGNARDRGNDRCGVAGVFEGYARRQEEERDSDGRDLESGRRRREARRASTLTSAVLLRQENSAICSSKEIKTTSFRSLPQSSLRSSYHGYVTTTSRSRFEESMPSSSSSSSGVSVRTEDRNRRLTLGEAKRSSEMFSQLRRLSDGCAQL